MRLHVIQRTVLYIAFIHYEGRQYEKTQNMQWKYIEHTNQNTEVKNTYISHNTMEAKQSVTIILIIIILCLFSVHFMLATLLLKPYFETDYLSVYCFRWYRASYKSIRDNRRIRHKFPFLHIINVL